MSEGIQAEIASISNGSIDIRNNLNDLTASEWIARTVTVFTQRGVGQKSEDAVIERQHPAPFSFQDVSRFIEFFTKRGERVLDPFCGVGSALKAAALLDRESIGIELNPKYVELSHERMKRELPPSTARKAKYKIIEGDLRKRVRKLQRESCQFIITSPPYWGILNKVDHKAKQERLANGFDHNYGEVEGDLSAIADYGEFTSTLADIFTDLSRVLSEKRYMTVIVGDFRHKDRYFMFHSDLAAEIEKRGQFGLKGIGIIYQKFKRVFPYGYPYSYVPNIHHQYALVFQKKPTLNAKP